MDFSEVLGCHLRPGAVNSEEAEVLQGRVQRALGSKTPRFGKIPVLFAGTAAVNAALSWLGCSNCTLVLLWLALVGISWGLVWLSDEEPTDYETMPSGF